MSKRLFGLLLLGLPAVLILSACVALPAQTGGTAVSTMPAFTPAPQPTVVVGTAVVSTAVSATSLPLTAIVPSSVTPPPPAEATPGQERQVTLDDDGKTINLKVGERFLLYLGEGYTWNVIIGDPNVIGQVVGVMTIRGSQGLFEARQVGTTTLVADGEPACAQSTPPCEMPSRLFQVQIVVQ